MCLPRMVNIAHEIEWSKGGTERKENVLWTFLVTGQLAGETFWGPRKKRGSQWAYGSRPSSRLGAGLI